jgi:putative transcriptional regulator
MYKTIEVDRENLTIMGVQFNDIHSLENTAQAIGTNMFEGLEPTKELIQLYVDWKLGIVAEKDFIKNLSEIYGR